MQLMAQSVALGDAAGGVRPVVGVVVAIDAEAYADGADALLHARCEIRPFGFGRIDEYTWKSDGVHLSFIVGVVDIFELPIVLIDERECGHGRSDERNEFRD